MSNELIRTMFKHLVKTYTVVETREILTAKFPEAKELVDSLNAEDFYEEERVQEAKTKRVKAEKQAKAEKVAKPRKSNGKNNKELAKDFVEKNLDKTRKEVIDIILNELEVSASMASNLYHYWKKELKNDSGKDL